MFKDLRDLAEREMTYAKRTLAEDHIHGRKPRTRLNHVSIYASSNIQKQTEKIHRTTCNTEVIS